MIVVSRVQRWHGGNVHSRMSGRVLPHRIKHARPTSTPTPRTMLWGSLTLAVAALGVTVRAAGAPSNIPEEMVDKVGTVLARVHDARVD